MEISIKMCLYKYLTKIHVIYYKADKLFFLFIYKR